MKKLIQIFRSVLFFGTLLFSSSVTQAQTITYSGDTAHIHTCTTPAITYLWIKNNTPNYIYVAWKGLNLYFNNGGFAGFIIDPWQYPMFMMQSVSEIFPNDSTQVIVEFYPDTLTGADSAIGQMEIYNPADSINTYKILTFIWTCTILSSQELHEAGNITLHPNPLMETLNIEMLYDGNYDLILYDITSRKVFETKVNKSNTINLANLKEGIYICQISHNSEVLKTAKIIKY